MSSFSLPPYIGLPSLGGWADISPRKRGRKSKEVEIAPGFSSIIQGISMKNPLKVSKTYGVTPFQIRGLLKGKKSKGSYWEFS